LATTTSGSVTNQGFADQSSTTAEQLAQYSQAVIGENYVSDNNNAYIYSGGGREQLQMGVMTPLSPGSCLAPHQQQQPLSAAGGSGGASLMGTPYKRNSSTFDNSSSTRMILSGSPARLAGGGAGQQPVHAASATFDFPLVAMTTVTSSTVSSENCGVQLSPTAINNNERGSHPQAFLGYGSPQSLERFRGRYGTTFTVPDQTNWNYQQQKQVTSSPKYGSLPRRAVKYGGAGGTYGAGTRTLMALDTASAATFNPTLAFNSGDQLEVTA
jgi:hypothetical protein